MTGPGGRGGRRSAPKGRPAPAADGAARTSKVVGEKSPRTSEQQRRAAERAREVRRRRAAERAGRAGDAEPGRAGGTEPGRADGTEPGRAGGTEPGRAGGTEPRRAGGTGPGRADGTGPGPRADAARTARPSAETARYRRRRIVAGVAVTAVLLMALAAGGWWALGRFGPPVSEVRVTGNRAVSTADVRAAADVAPGTPLASVDTAGVGARVAGIPGVATVEVARSWPDALTVAVTERTPVAVADAPGGRRLVDATGLAYRTLPPSPPRLPLLALPRVAPDDPATRAAVELLAALPVPLRDQVDTVVAGPGGTTLELVLTEGRRVLWGRWSETADTPAKIAILGPLLSREGSVYDVSSPALPTVRR